MFLYWDKSTKGINHMDEEVEIMSAEEFFGRAKAAKSPSRGGKAHGNKMMHERFTEVKINMVMRIYGVSRAKAEKIIAERETRPAEDDAAVNPFEAKGDRKSIEVKSAKDFFEV